MRRIPIFLALFCLTVSLCAANARKVRIAYGESAQFEIISPQGVRVLIDVHDPGVLSKPASKDDILLTSHFHPDHIALGFTDSFPGRQIPARIGELAQGDVRIKSIASSHTADEDFPPENGSNYIFIIDTAGLRIVHFGDIGQEKLTASQLKDIAGTDIALAPFYNQVSNMNLENKKGFDLMAQVNPKLIIPTDYDEATARYALKLWAGSLADQPAIRVSRQDIAGMTQIVFMGALGQRLGQMLNLAKIKL